MTWNDLKDKIEAMTQEQRNFDVMFFSDIEGEYGKVQELYFPELDEIDSLAPGRPFLCGLE